MDNKVFELTNDIVLYQKVETNLKDKIEEQNTMISNKDKLILVLSEQIDIGQFVEIIDRWATSITKGQYFESLTLMISNGRIGDNLVNLIEYRQIFENNINIISTQKIPEIESPNVSKEGTEKEDKVTDDSNEGNNTSENGDKKEEDKDEVKPELVYTEMEDEILRVYIKVPLFINFSKQSENKVFNEEEGTYVFSFEYSDKFKQWFISRIMTLNDFENEYNKNQ